MVLSVRNLFALFLLCLFSNTLWSQTNAAFFEYPVDSACNRDASLIPVINQSTPGGSFFSTPAGLSLDPVSGAIYPLASSAGTYQVTHTITSPTSVSHTETFTVIAPENSHFSYPIIDVCKGSISLLPVDTAGVSSGTYFVFSAFPPTSFLTIDPLTGTINVDASSAGNFTIAHVTGLFPCNDTSFFSFQIFDPTPYDLDYGVDTVCPTGVLCPLMPAPGPGVFRPRAGLAYSNDTLGCIDLASTTPNRQYIICYEETAGCRRTFCDTIYVLGSEDPTFSYPASTICGNEDSLIPFILGSPGGFTYIPSLVNSTLDLNSSNGTVYPVNSSPDTYTIFHTTTGFCPDTASIQLTIAPSPVIPSTLTNYGDTLLELNTSFFTIWYCDSTVVATDVNSIPVTMQGQYYVIVQDPQGCEAYSDTVNIGVTSLQNGNFPRHLVKVFPNPSNDVFQIQTEQLSRGKLQLTIHDLYGRMIHTKEIIPGTGGELDLSNEPTGIYLLRINYQNTSTTLKLIKTSNQ